MTQGLSDNCPLCFCHSLLFIFPIPLFNHLSPNISDIFDFHSWLRSDSLLDDNLTIIWVKYNFDKLYASEINRMQKYLFLMIYVGLFRLRWQLSSLITDPYQFFIDPVMFIQNMSQNCPRLFKAFFHFSLTPVLFSQFYSWPVSRSPLNVFVFYSLSWLSPVLYHSS